MRTIVLVLGLAAGLAVQSSAEEPTAAGGQNAGVETPEQAQAPIDTRTPVPSADSQKAADATIRDIFKDEFKKTTPQDQLAFAANLIQQAKDTKDDAAARYKLLTIALSLTTRNGAVAETARAAQCLSSDFQVDPVKTLLTALNDVEHKVTAKDRFLELERSYESIGDECVVNEDFATATLAYASAQQSSRSGQDIARYSTIGKKLQAINERKIEMNKVTDAKATLVSKPADPDANLVLGKYLCLRRGDWNQGLPLVVKSGDLKWKEAATGDTASPKEGAVQLSVADCWYDLAAKLPVAEQDSVRARAIYWYSTALPSLSGLSHAKAAKRIEELQRITNGKIEVPTVKSNEINLLALVDPNKDAPSGRWTLKDGELASDGAGWARIQLPYQPPDEYDLRMTFTRVGGTSGVFIVLANSQHQFLWAMGDWNNTVFGFEVIKGDWDNKNPTTLKRGMETGKKHSCTVKVRKDSVAVIFDEAPLIEYKTDFTDWSMDPAWSIRNNRALGVGSRDSPTVFHSIEVVEISGPGTTLSQKPKVAPASGSKSPLVGEYSVYDSNKLIGTMELFADGGIKGWKGWKKDEYHWSVNGDTLTLKWTSTQDTFKIQPDGKLVGTSPDSKNMYAEMKK